MTKMTVQSDGYHHIFVDGGATIEDINLEFMGIKDTIWADTGIGIVGLSDDPKKPFEKPIRVTPLNSHFLSSKEQKHKARVTTMEKMAIITGISFAPRGAWLKIYSDSTNAIKFSQNTMNALMENMPLYPTSFSSFLAELLQKQLLRMESVEIIYTGKGSASKTNPFVKHHMRLAHNQARIASGQAPNKTIYNDFADNDVQLTNDPTKRFRFASNREALSDTPPIQWPPVVDDDWQPN